MCLNQARAGSRSASKLKPTLHLLSSCWGHLATLAPGSPLGSDQGSRRGGEVGTGSVLNGGVVKPLNPVQLMAEHDQQTSTPDTRASTWL